MNSSVGSFGSGLAESGCASELLGMTSVIMEAKVVNGRCVRGGVPAYVM
jgi:hypothetical protein